MIDFMSMGWQTLGVLLFLLVVFVAAFCWVDASLEEEDRRKG